MKPTNLLFTFCNLAIPTQELASGIYSIIYYGGNAVHLNEKFFVQ